MTTFIYAVATQLFTPPPRVPLKKASAFFKGNSDPPPLRRGGGLKLPTVPNPIYRLGENFQPEAEDADAEDAEDEPQGVHPFAQ